jgi:hypothetical protein
MKKLAWTSLAFLVLTITSCGLLPDQAANTGPDPVTTPIQTQPVAPETELPIVSPTPAAPPPTQEPPGPTPTAIAPQQEITPGKVNVNALNLRIGPGTNHPVLRLLHEGQALEIHGRSEKLDWLLVALPSGTQGWVATEFVDTQVNIASLPLREAYGGPYFIQPELPDDERKPLDVRVVIENNIATVTISGFPGNSKILAKLGPAGGATDLVVASGTTSPNGNAILEFSMPAEWPIGNPVKSGEQTLVVAAQDGTFSTQITIQYYR